MKVLVLGGTRFIGPWVVRALVEGGHSVAVFHRGRSEADLPGGVEAIRGDRADLRSHRARFAALAPEVVVHMIAMTPQHAWDLLDVFDGVAPRVVLVSSADVYRAFGAVNRTEVTPPCRAPLTEAAPLRTRLFPYRERLDTLPADAEEREWLSDYDKILVERVAASSPTLSCVVARLPMVHGPGDPRRRFSDVVRRMVDERPAILLSEEQATWRATRGYVEDVGAAVAALAGHAAASGAYNLGEPDARPHREWVEAIGHALGWQGEVVSAPAARLPQALRSEADLRHPLRLDTGRLRQELGYVEPTPPEEALLRTARWLRDVPPPGDEPAPDYAAEDAALLALRGR